MTLAEKAYKELQKLPEPLIQEVIDFIEFLEAKNSGAAEYISGQEASLKNIWENEEDEIWNEFKTG